VLKTLLMSGCMPWDAARVLNHCEWIFF